MEFLTPNRPLIGFNLETIGLRDSLDNFFSFESVGDFQIHRLFLRIKFLPNSLLRYRILLSPLLLAIKSNRIYIDMVEKIRESGSHSNKKVLFC